MSATAISGELAPRPLTDLTSEEILFRDTVRKFARERIAPLIRPMDESAHLDPSLLRDIFQLGLMGIEIPEDFGGQGGNFFQCVQAIEEISAKQVESVRATGAGFLSVLIMGVQPQVLPRFIGFATYQLDSNLRNSTMSGASSRMSECRP